MSVYTAISVTHPFFIMIDLLCQRMPLSCMVRGLLERCFSPAHLDDLFARHAKEQYTRNLLFSTVCELLLQVVLRVRPSLHAAYQAKQAEMGVSAVALYDKLKGVETDVSAALVRQTARDLSAIQDALKVAPTTWLPGYSIRILDVNCLAASEKRLRAHQGVSGAPLPGKSLVVLDPQRRLLVDVFPCEDGHAQERSLIGSSRSDDSSGRVVDRRSQLLHLWISERHSVAQRLCVNSTTRRAAASRTDCLDGADR
jgi:hypothetical protein